MIAPELWQIKDKAGEVDVDVTESKGTLRKLFVPDARDTVEWGEASFAVPHMTSSYAKSMVRGIFKSWIICRPQS